MLEGIHPGRGLQPLSCVAFTADSRQQFKRLPDHIEDDFLVQVLDKPARGEVLLDLVLTNADYIIK